MLTFITLVKVHPELSKVLNDISAILLENYIYNTVSQIEFVYKIKPLISMLLSYQYN